MYTLSGIFCCTIFKPVSKMPLEIFPVTNLRRYIQAFGGTTPVRSGFLYSQHKKAGQKRLGPIFSLVLWLFWKAYTMVWPDFYHFRCPWLLSVGISERDVQDKWGGRRRVGSLRTDGRRKMRLQRVRLRRLFQVKAIMLCCNKVPAGKPNLFQCEAARLPSHVHLRNCWSSLRPSKF